MNFIVGIILGSAFAGFFGYAAGIDEGYSRGYRNCVEHRAKTMLLQEARDLCTTTTKYKMKTDKE